jgi:putative DNA primase/helicase
MDDVKLPSWASDGIPLARIVEGYDAAEERWLALIAFIDSRGELREKFVPRSLLRQRAELLKTLDDVGAQIPTEEAAVQRLVEKLRKESDKKVRLVRKPGWIGNRFILSDNPDTGVRQHPDLAAGGTPRPGRAGTLEGWQAVLPEIACSSRMLFAVCLGFAAPLVRPAAIEPGGVHLFGRTTTGKSTSGFCASSVYGDPRTFATDWNGTALGIEETSPLFNDLVWSIDDLSKFKGTNRELAAVIQAVSYGVTAGRSRRRSVIAPSPLGQDWCTLIISSGEESLSAVAARAGRPRKGGEGVRMADIDAGAGRGWGVFERLPKGRNSLAEALTAIRQGLSENHGEAGARFVELLAIDLERDREGVLEKLHERMVYWRRKAGLDGSSPAPQLRHARLFELAYAAGRLATNYGILPLEREILLKATLRCYRAAAPPGADPLEEGLSRLAARLRHTMRFQDMRGEKPPKRDPGARGYLWRHGKRDVVLISRDRAERWIGVAVPAKEVLNMAAQRGWLVQNSRGTSIQPGQAFGSKSYLAFLLGQLPPPDRGS